MLTYLQAIILGLVQGITELFPISSLGHSVILPSLFGWQVNQKDPTFLIFLVATHAATALVLFLFFFADWRRIINGFLRSLKNREVSENDPDAKLAWLLVIGTIPAGILGLLFDEKLKDLFASPQLVAFVLIFNGLMLYSAELIKKQSGNLEVGYISDTESDRRIARLSWPKTIKIGLLQCVALIPGFSRTGSTITGGLLVGLNHEDAARFSFLLATPIIGAAAVLKLPELASQANQQAIGPILIGALCAAIAAFFSVKFLTKYFEKSTLKPFAIYCIVAGVLLSGWYLLRF